MAESVRLVTAEDLEKYPDDDYRYELVAGRVIRMSPVGYAHGHLVTRMVYLLLRHLNGGRSGAVLTEVGFKLASDPDTVRAPDVAFVRRERIPSPDPRGFLPFAPDLAVEVLSPDDRPAEIRAKVHEYLEAGAPLVLVVDPDEKIVTLYRHSSSPETLRTSDAVLDLSEVIPGFRCALREVFD